MDQDVEIGTSTKGMLVLTLIKGGERLQVHISEKQALRVMSKIAESLPQMREDHNQYQDFLSVE